MDQKIEFNELISDIIKNLRFKKLKNEKHHGITRLDHSLNVAKVTYYFAKKLNMKNYKEITRAALLHDLFFNSEVDGEISLLKHPSVAAINAKKEFNIGDIEESMIKSHMFPLILKIPKNKESWLLVSTDKIVAAYEMLKYKLPLKAEIYYLLFINLITK